MSRKPKNTVLWSKGMTIKEVEKKIILSCLKSNNGNRTQTAIDLGISVKSVYNKLKDYDCLQKY